MELKRWAVPDATSAFRADPTEVAHLRATGALQLALLVGVEPIFLILLHPRLRLAEKKRCAAQGPAS